MTIAAIAMTALVCTIAWSASGGDTTSTVDEKKVAERLPNSGYVGDSVTALQIGKVVLTQLLTPHDLNKKEFSEAKLKDGIWIVSYWEATFRINFPIVIHIRQKTGAIVKYEDPNA